MRDVTMFPSPPPPPGGSFGDVKDMLLVGATVRGKGEDTLLLTFGSKFSLWSVEASSRIVVGGAHRGGELNVL
jgi:hypothetical protein